MAPKDDQKPDLERYRAKRSADSTTEPFGGQVERPRAFVIHKHDATRLHWDLRLEWDGVLWSWAVPRGPCLDPNVKRLAVKVEEHPVEYADFEGVIPAGNYGAGAMIVWDRGRWTPHDPPDEGLEKGMIHFELHGYKLRGGWTLVRLKDSPKDWLFIKKADGWHIEEGQDPPYGEESILSGLTVEELGQGETRAQKLSSELEALGVSQADYDPRRITLMQAETADAPFSSPDWVFELKYDGYRLAAVRSHSGEPQLRYRSGNNATDRFPEICRALRSFPYPDFVLDGEVVVLDDHGRPDFQLLQRRAQLANLRDVERATVSLPVTFFVFDLLAFGPWDLRSLPLLQRKRFLRQLLPSTGPIRFCDHIEAIGEQMFEKVEAMGLEGLMAKKIASSYQSGRSDDWLKIPISRSDDFVIVGFTRPSGQRTGIGALCLAAYKDGELQACGRVGTGFSEDQLESLARDLDTIVVDSPTCVGDLPSDGVWTKPELVCEVKFKHVTSSGALRHPVFIRLRDDKRAIECHLPEVRVEVEPEALAEVQTVTNAKGERNIRFTRPEKIFWPEDGYTKGDLIEFYRAVSPWLLPYLRQRPVVLTRFPDGIHGKSFFQKDAPGFLPDWVRRETMWSQHAEREINYIICDNHETLLLLANLGTIPLHIWASRLGSLEAPDWCVIDLDPKEAPFRDVVTLALGIKALCDEIGLPCFPKTSGSTGMHVMIPLGGQCTYEQSRMFGQLIGQIMCDRFPEIATITRSISGRDGKVYVDYIQNGHGRLVVSPLCARPRIGATVSTPLRWEEVTLELDPDQFNIRSVPERLRAMGEDPLRPVLQLKPDLLKALGALAAILD
ncbi:MAG: DNA ligase D [Myxococcales bacterium]|nr:DNA ligase D [Myxococcales bacterium]